MSKALVRSAAPDFSGNAVVNGEFTTIKLSDYKGKWLVLFFYPLGRCIIYVAKKELTSSRLHICVPD